LLRESGWPGLLAVELPRAGMRFFRWIRRDSDGRDRPQGLGLQVLIMDVQTMTSTNTYEISGGLCLLSCDGHRRGLNAVETGEQ
jgi:hypothetical protein